MLIASPFIKRLRGGRFRARSFYPCPCRNDAQVRIRYGFNHQVARVLPGEFDSLLILLRRSQIFARRPVQHIHGRRSSDVGITERPNDGRKTREAESESRQVDLLHIFTRAGIHGRQ